MIFTNEISLSDIAAVVSSFLVIMGGLFGCYQWRKNIILKRAKYINDLTEKIRTDKDIKDVIYIFDYNENWYSYNFHESGELELKVDKTLSYFSYICYLKKLNVLSNKEFDFFKYEILRILSNTQVQDYFYNLYHFSNELGTPFTFIYLFEYGEKIQVFDKDFYDKNAYINNHKYHHILNWQISISEKVDKQTKREEVVNQIKKRSEFQKKFKDHYNKHWQEIEKEKSPTSYRAMQWICIGCTGLMLLLSILYWLGLSENFLLGIGVVLVELILLYIIDERSIFFQDYKKRCLETSIQAIDKTFEDIWDNKGVIYKEHCILVFEQKYNKAFETIARRLFSNSLIFFLTVAFIVINWLLPSPMEIPKMSEFIVLVVIALQLIAKNISLVIKRLYEDMLYTHVTKDYKSYLAEKYVSDENIEYMTEGQ